MERCFNSFQSGTSLRHHVLAFQHLLCPSTAGAVIRHGKDIAAWLSLSLLLLLLSTISSRGVSFFLNSSISLFEKTSVAIGMIHFDSLHTHSLSLFLALSTLSGLSISKSLDFLPAERATNHYTDA